jgi:hypothetical protein
VVEFVEGLNLGDTLLVLLFHEIDELLCLTGFQLSLLLALLGGLALTPNF